MSFWPATVVEKESGRGPFLLGSMRGCPGRGFRIWKCISGSGRRGAGVFSLGVGDGSRSSSSSGGGGNSDVPWKEGFCNTKCYH